MKIAKSIPFLLVALACSQVTLADVESKPTPQWIWTPVQQPGEMPNGACFFRRTFDVARFPTKGILEVAADDAFEVYVNGRTAGRGEGWEHFTRFDISDHLQPGKNAVAIKVINRTPGHAGLAGRLTVGSKQMVTDVAWRTSLRALPKWKHSIFADARWRTSAVLGPWMKTKPWIPASHAEAITSRLPDDDDQKTSRTPDTSSGQVVLASAEEDLFRAKSPVEPGGDESEPLLLQPLAQTKPPQPVDNSQPRWSTDLRGGGPQEIRNPFLKRRSVKTPTDASAPEIGNLQRTEQKVASLPLRPTPDASPRKNNTSVIPEGGVGDVPLGDTRFSPVAGFAVEEVLSADRAGSIIAATFNEFGDMILAREKGPLLITSDTDRDGKIDEVREYCSLVTNCQGILALSGMVFVVGEGPNGPGLYRLRDVKRQGKLDDVTLLVSFDVTGQEHGPHGIALGPDGKLYVTCGNHTSINKPFADSSPRQHLYEGDLIPRYEDPGGHAAGVKVPAGFVLRTDVEGKQAELFASGFRNVYDLAFNGDGELFCHDSDMESDMTSPWYRPTQLYFVQPGSEIGWRSGWAKWPEHFLDKVLPAAETGRGSPTGAVFYHHYAYPAAFRDVLFLGDWSEGRILVAKPQRKGAGYVMETDVFLKGRPLNITDLDVGPDGMLYFVTGGRGTDGGVFRVRWNGKPNTPSAATSPLQEALRSPQIASAWGRQRVATLRQQMGEMWTSSLTAAAKNSGLPVEERIQAIQMMQWVGPLPGSSLLLELSEDRNARVRRFATYLLSSVTKDERVPLRLIELLTDEDAGVRRQACESLVRAERPVPYRYLVPLLKSRDRFEATAARTLLQLENADRWEAPALEAKDIRVFIQAASAMMVAWPNEKRALAVVKQSLKRMQGYMTDDDFVDLLRVLQLAVLRGDLEPERVPQLQGALAAEFPANHHIMNREIVRLLVRLQVASVKDRYLDYLDSDIPEEERIHVATHLRFLKTEWSTDEKLRLFKHLKPSSSAGGSVGGYLENVAREFSKRTDPVEDSAMLDQGYLVPGAALEVVMRLPNELTDKQVRRLIMLDEAVESEDDLSKKLKVAILAVLARDGSDRGMAYLRKVYDNEPNRRVECTIGLAEQPDGANWPYLVKSLPNVNKEVTHEIIKKLLTAKRTPQNATPYRQVILAGLRLGDQGGDDAVRLLERWRGFASTEHTPPWKEALRAWQNWYAKTYPSEPIAKITQRKAREPWDHKKLLAHLSDPKKLDEASIARGKEVFVRAQCAKCHQHGELGEAMGPNLTSLGNRFPTREIVESMLYPSKVVSDQYKSKTLVTREGQTYTGIVGSGGTDSLLVLQQDGKKVRVSTKQVEQTVPSEVSSMPEGLLDELTLEQVTDLVAFLKQSPETRVANKDDESSTQ